MWAFDAFLQGSSVHVQQRGLTWTNGMAQSKKKHKRVALNGHDPRRHAALMSMDLTGSEHQRNPRFIRSTTAKQLNQRPAQQELNGGAVQKPEHTRTVGEVRRAVRAVRCAVRGLLGSAADSFPIIPPCAFSQHLAGPVAPPLQ